MKSLTLDAGRGSCLRKNSSKRLAISIIPFLYKSLFLINETQFIPGEISQDDLLVAPNHHYMIINNSEEQIEIEFDQDVSSHDIIYDPYKYETFPKTRINPKEFLENHEVPDKYIDVLPKWYSIKFTYPEYNLIYIKPEMGISFQIHHKRKEYWEILEGKPIILNGTEIYYYVESGTHFESPIGSFHSVINPNKKEGKYVVLKEQWQGKFNESDIERIFNPNHYDD